MSKFLLLLWKKNDRNLKFMTHAIRTITLATNFMDLRHPRQNFDPRHPRHFFLTTSKFYGPTPPTPPTPFF